MRIGGGERARPVGGRALAAVAGVLWLAAPVAAFSQVPTSPVRHDPGPVEVAAADTVARSLADTAALGAFLDGVMEAFREELDIPAAVVAVVRDGRVLYAAGYGHADPEEDVAIDPATSLFRVGSVSKLFTWTAVMQLVEAGKLDLDTDVNRYLESVRIPDTYPEPITLRHIMTHTPGFEDGFLGYLIREDSAVDASSIPSIEEAMRRHMPERVRPPGRLAAYSNYATALAGLIVERVSRVPFADYIERNIFEPLGMRYATFREPLPAELEPYAVTGTARERGVRVAKPYEIVGGFAPAGAAAVSALDMVRFMVAHLQEGRYGDARILETGTARRMHRRAFDHDPRLPGMALGFYEQEINGLRVIGHGGDTFRFHTDMLLVPETRLGLFVSYVGGGEGAVREGLARAFFDRYLPVEESPNPPTPADFDWTGQEYAGAYRFIRMNYTDLDKLLYLLQPPIRVSALPTGRLLVSGGLRSEPSQFVAVEKDLFREVGGHARLAFGRDDAGTVERIYFSGAPFMATERVPWYERAFLWYALLAISAVVFLTVLTGLVSRWKEIRAMPGPEQRVVWSSVATAGWFCLTVIAAAVVLGTTETSLLSEVPAALKAVLLMPLLFVVLAVVVVTGTVLAWWGRYWTAWRRVHQTLVALAAVSICWFLIQWNVLGWQFG